MGKNRRRVKGITADACVEIKILPWAKKGY
jgi:hypothetical protein